MFILFGVDVSLHERIDFQVLDTDSWTWIENYIGPGRNNNDITNQSPPDNSRSGDGLSGGTIAGVAVGAIAGVSYQNVLKVCYSCVVW